MSQSVIYCEQLSDAQRNEVPAKLFGVVAFRFKVEPAIFDVAGMLAAEYQGGYWEMHSLSNGGWYMSPSSAAPFNVSFMNAFAGAMTADALGITACLFCLQPPELWWQCLGRGLRRAVPPAAGLRHGSRRSQLDLGRHRLTPNAMDKVGRDHAGRWPSHFMESRT